jgi:hypothetical protein
MEANLPRVVEEATLRVHSRSHGHREMVNGSEWKRQSKTTAQRSSTAFVAAEAERIKQQRNRRGHAGAVPRISSDRKSPSKYQRTSAQVEAGGYILSLLRTSCLGFMLRGYLCGLPSMAPPSLTNRLTSSSHFLPCPNPTAACAISCRRITDTSSLSGLI